MKRLCALLLALCFLPGCAFHLLNKAVSPDALSPEQVKAYNQVGLDVYMCFQLGGPPPVGSVAFFLWPKTKAMMQMFGANCQIIQKQAA